MRILHVIDSLDATMGGLPRAALSLAGAQSQLGFEVSVLYYSDTRQEAEFDAAYADIPGISLVGRLSLIRPSKREWLFGKAARGRIRAASPHFIHIHGLWEPLLRNALCEAARMKVPAVVTPHGMMHPWQDRFCRIRKWILIRVLGWGKAWRSCLFARALTPPEARHLEGKGYFPRVEVIPNGVDPDPALSQIEAWPVGIPPQPYVLGLGRLAFGKGTDLLLEAFLQIAGEFPDLNLVLAGADYGLQAKLQKMAAASGLGHRVIFPGNQPGPQKWRLLRHTQCFCLPSRAEGFGLVLLEAVMAGVPVVQSDACWFRELVERGHAVSFGARPEDLAETLRQTLNAPPTQTGGEFVRTHFSWQRIARQLQEAIAPAENTAF
ncbi:MAG: glycosyltransferase [Verrucomicrobia bacterium]|nr:glycosyltransferase [Verrucomicrobiota bacterium]MCH8511362.1 glycosyltransferase [Kiritimatiellia bacterium]